MPISLPDFTAFLHREIPLTRSIAVEVIAWDGCTVRLTAPLAPNQNHADTAFGGSISSLGILAGYCLLHLLIQERGISTRILIQSSNCEFLRPIDADFSASATVPERPIVDEFFATLERKRRARIELAAQVECRKLLTARHTGVYVAMLY